MNLYPFIQEKYTSTAAKLKNLPCFSVFKYNYILFNQKSNQLKYFTREL